MSEYRYPARALNGDLARAGIGIVLCATPLAVVPLQPWAMVALGVPVALFVLFGARTWMRRSLRIAVDESGITAAGPGAGQIRWNDLRRFKLSYFSTRRDRSNGWLQLNLGGPSARLSFDSNLDGFDDICHRAFRAAVDNSVELSAATLRNLAELGLVADLAEKTHADSGTGWGNPADWRR